MDFHSLSRLSDQATLAQRTNCFNFALFFTSHLDLQQVSFLDCNSICWLNLCHRSLTSKCFSAWNIFFHERNIYHLRMHPASSQQNMLAMHIQNTHDVDSRIGPSCVSFNPPKAKELRAPIKEKPRTRKHFIDLYFS